jgi:hypothetical protein
MRRCLALTFLAISAGGGAEAATTGTPVVRPEQLRLAAGPGFDLNEKTRKSVSGIACQPAGGAQPCLFVFDEGVRAQFATLGADGVSPSGRTFQLTGGGKELDAEGAAMDGTYFYVVGSHAAKRNDCKSNPASRYLVRFKVAPAVPAASRAGPAPPEIQELQETQTLWDLMTRDAFLGRYADGCLGTGTGGRPEQMQRRPGINIEGIASREGRLYFGFRGPSLAGAVPVYSVDSAAVFDGTDAKPQLTHLEAGEHAGIRDLVAGKDALLLLLGPDDQEPVRTLQWRVAEWTPGGPASTPVRLRILGALDLSGVTFANCAGSPKPEALTILQETATEYRVAVLSDGVCDGGALIFRLRK